ncbi:MAG TPA: C4-dicarboxylate ABC transporter substrate-binding protein, partial [Sneathiellales bacterium]|nr:C4-dicarboxylate ABC transporter substrate-binding protein [Sneathiellales bacterium]
MSLAIGFGFAATSSAKELKLSYFMGPPHPMNAAVFTPFGEKLAEVSGGMLTVKQFPGGALNSAPPKQYSILLDGIADVAFGLPGYTAQLFPITNVLTVPNVAGDAVDGTKALWRA